MPPPTSKDAASQDLHGRPARAPDSTQVPHLRRRSPRTHRCRWHRYTSGHRARRRAQPATGGGALRPRRRHVGRSKASQDLFVLEVTPENRVVFRVPRAEVGQGITTALAIIVADEIDARLVDVDAPLEDARQDLGTAQSTGGSSSVRSLWDPVRSIAAEARARLVTAAAEQWDLQAD